jgi:hypothetical protein
MRYQYTTLLFAALTTLVTANLNLRANYIPQLFNERSVRPAGGWAVGLNPDETCPNLIGTAQSCGPRWCCPPDLVCHPKNETDIAAACCPAGMLSPFANYQSNGPIQPHKQPILTLKTRDRLCFCLPSSSLLRQRQLVPLECYFRYKRHLRLFLLRRRSSGLANWGLHCCG